MINLKDFVKKILDPIVFNYFFLFDLMLSKVAFVNDFANTICKLFVVWAIILVLYNIKSKKMRLNIPLSLFLLFMVITIILNYKANLYLNLVMLAFVNCYILVSLIKYKPNNNLLFSLNNIYLVLTTVFALISVLMFFFNYTFTVNEVYFGYHWNVLYGVFDNPNSGSIICVISIFILIMNMVIMKADNVKIKSKVKYFYGFSLLVISIYLFLADSRGGQLALISFACCYIFLYVIKYIKKHRVIKLLSILILFFFLSIVVIKSPLTQVKRIYENLKISEVDDYVETNPENDVSQVLEKENPVINEQNKKPISSEMNQNKENETSDEPSDEFRKEENISSSRFTLWKAGFVVIRNNPLFGVGQANVLDYVKAASDDESIDTITAGGVHNGFIDLAVSNGIIGLLLFIVSIGGICISSLKIIFCSKNKNNVLIRIASTSIIFAILVNNLVETSMIMAIFVTAQFFWMNIGFLNNYE